MPAIGATVLYGQNGQMTVVMTSEDVERLCSEGWADSPAAFGIETHPSQPVEFLPLTGQGGGASSADLTALQQSVAELQQAVSLGQEQIADLQDRLAVLEGLLTAPPTQDPATTQPPEPDPPKEPEAGTRGRK